MISSNFVELFSSSNSIPRDLQWSYLHSATERPLIGATIGKLVQSAAEKYGQREAYVSAHQTLRYTFEDLLEKARNKQIKKLNNCDKDLLEKVRNKRNKIFYNCDTDLLEKVRNKQNKIVHNCDKDLLEKVRNK